MQDVCSVLMEKKLASFSHFCLNIDNAEADLTFKVLLRWKINRNPSLTAQPGPYKQHFNLGWDQGTKHHFRLI